MLGSINLNALLRTISSNLQTPVVFLLLLLMALTVIMLGALVGEALTERIYFRKKAPDIAELVEEIHKQEKPLKECISEKNFLKRQKDLLLELLNHPEITDLERESLAARLLTQHKGFLDRKTRITDIIAKIGPMLGLMGTLIPLGPGIVALGQGDTYTLSNSLMIAFDTTVAGLVCAAVALLISTIRKAWYKNDMSVLETVMECILEEVKTDA